MHVWLPEAHPAAPSPVSAMMSGIMLKTAIYGLLRITFDLLHVQFWQWGVAVLALGLFSALFGAIFAGVQTDMKRLLAYSSIENIGLIFTGIGLSILFAASNMRLLPRLPSLRLCSMPSIIRFSKACCFWPPAAFCMRRGSAAWGNSAA